MRVLVAEDDPGLRSVLARGLREHGYVVDAVGDGADAVAYALTYEYEVIVLDWRMPKADGMDVLARLRARGTRTPILMLTARDTHADRVAGLDAGADDYLVKPFDFSELLARLRALQRRPAQAPAHSLHVGEVHFDPATRIVSYRGEPIDLTSTEMGILEVLLRRSPSVVTRLSIASQVWDDEADAVGSNTIDVHIGRLRNKLRDTGAVITTVRGLGYRLEQQ
ncbi:response regulator transcription factor [Acidiferrimicrobium sp. IK]|uniref:response regulator transcription factor n=1 Tax=Acidiferrimicrobium sp. IK TaxID=2871700 RepID=UPI0021CB2529|nr:response regulator transcription factor [Acidiferrimicrobium sp. IK]MCU4187003.1 response regulator transcription factor [Acidiferrimicrobium sp. IK]